MLTESILGALFMTNLQTVSKSEAASAGMSSTEQIPTISSSTVLLIRVPATIKVNNYEMSLANLNL
jgi:hypothetical protein